MRGAAHRFGGSDAVDVFSNPPHPLHLSETILCVGEKIEQRQAGQTDAVNAAQLTYGLAGVTAEQMTQVTIAYEPVWASGTGKTATAADAQAAHMAIRRCLADRYTPPVANATRIQYCGSVKPANARELFDRPDIDDECYLWGGLSTTVSRRPVVSPRGDIYHRRRRRTP